MLENCFKSIIINLTSGFYHKIYLVDTWYSRYISGSNVKKCLVLFKIINSQFIDCYLKLLICQSFSFNYVDKMFVSNSKLDIQSVLVILFLFKNRKIPIDLKHFAIMYIIITSTFSTKLSVKYINCILLTY